MSVAYIFNGANNEYIWHSLKAMNSFYMEPPAPDSRQLQWRPYKHPITTHWHCYPPTPMLLLPRLWLVWWCTKCAYC